MEVIVFIIGISGIQVKKNNKNLSVKPESALQSLHNKGNMDNFRLDGVKL